jgi:DNA-binding CsgD family transcriptional regulator
LRRPGEKSRNRVPVVPNGQLPEWSTPGRGSLREGIGGVLSREEVSSALVLREALARSPLAAVLLDADDRVVFANQRACSMLGLAAAGGGWARSDAEFDIQLKEETLADEGWHHLGITDVGMLPDDQRRGKVWASLGPGEGGTDTPLTRREREILGLVAVGLRTEEIAGELTVSPETVKSHVHNAMQKLRAHTRSQAVAIAISTGQVSYTGGAVSSR